MSSACITNAWCVIARFNEFGITLNTPTKKTRAKQLNWFRRKQEHATVSQPVAVFPVNALMPERNTQRGGKQTPTIGYVQAHLM